MKIHLSQFAGFCDGVKRAYEIIEAMDIVKAKKPVCILGSLAHNADVARKIEEKGIEKIDFQDFLKSSSKKIGTIITTAHGVGPEVFEIAQKKNIKLIDTTCPKVIKVQRLAQVFFKRNYEIILVGDRDHKEVEGINAWGKGKAVIVSNRVDLKNVEFKKNTKIVVLSQTTQSEVFFEEVSSFFKKNYPKAEIISTICDATHKRQEEIRKLAGNSEAVIVIGSETSANSKRLYEIALGINGRSFFIENSKGIRNEWFVGVNSVAVTAGASTPSWIISQVLDKLNKI